MSGCQARIERDYSLLSCRQTALAPLQSQRRLPNALYRHADGALAAYMARHVNARVEPCDNDIQRKRQGDFFGVLQMRLGAGARDNALP